MAQLVEQGLGSRPWFLAKPEDVSAAAIEWVDTQHSHQRGRRTRLLRWRSSYHGRQCNRLSDEIYGDGVEAGALASEPLTPGKSVSNAAVAKIASKQRPKGQWLTKGADYKHRIQAKYRSYFCEGILYQRQGRHANTWEVMQQAFRDCTIGEGGCVQVERDVARKMVAHKHTKSWEYVFDSGESESGRPRTLGRRSKVPRWDLLEEYPERKRDIMTAPLHSEDAETGPLTVANDTMLSLYEVWRLPIPDGKGGWKNGRYIKTIVGADKPLEDKPYRWPNFPLVILTFLPNSSGMWGEPVVERTATVQTALNDVAGRINRNVRLLSGGWMDVEEDSHDKAELESNSAMKVLHRKPGRPPAQIEMPPPFSPATLQWCDWLWGKAHEQAQVSELNASGRIEPGITAAVAMRARNDLQSELFLPQSRMYEEAFATLALLDVQAARDMADDGIELETAYEKSGVMRMIKWETIQEEDEDLFEVVVHASNATEDTLAGRRQTITELAQSGALSPETASKLLTDANPDPLAFSRRVQAQERYIEQIIEELLEAMPESYKMDDFPTLDPYLDLDAGILQFVDAYVEALADRVPEYNRELMRRWMQLADKEVARRVQQPSASAAQPPVDPMVAATMGAPAAPAQQPGPSQAASVESTMLQ